MNHMSNYGADIEFRTKVGGAPATLHLCTITIIIQKESTPLSIACEYQKTEMFKLLLSQSDDCTQQTKVFHDVIVAIVTAVMD